MFNRPKIPVRDGLRLPFRPRFLPRVLTEPGAVEYVRGAGAGYLVGFCWGALLVGVVAGAAWPTRSPYQPVYEKQGHQLIGWCGGPAPKEIPQQGDEVDITWFPTCEGK